MPEMINDNVNPFDLKFDEILSDKLDDTYESDDEIDSVFDNEQYKKINYLRKLGELSNKGHKLDKHYSVNDTIQELEYAYKFNSEIFMFQQSKLKVDSFRTYFLEENNLQYYVDNWMTTGLYCVNMLNIYVLQYIVNHDQELWQKLTQIMLYFLRSEMLQNLINKGFEWIGSNIDTSKSYVNSLKQTILRSDENTFVRLKKSTMEQNYKLISNMEDDNDIEYHNRQEIIKLLIKINSIVSEIKETTGDLLGQIDNIFSSNEKIIEFAEQIKIFIFTNLECTTAHDVFYYKYIVPRVEQNILLNTMNDK
jgi:hypothetical protein